MATKVTHPDGAVVASFAAADTDNDHVVMGPLVGNSFTAQIAVNTETLQGSNDGVNFDVIATAAAANDVVLVTGVPRFIRSPTANTGAIVVVGYRRG